MANTSADYECPVCNEDFKKPKILDCNHLVCRGCVLKWLQKNGGQAGCPLCRAPILPPSDLVGQDRLTTMVDSLPTDLATLALVDSHQVLTGPHVCATCKNNVRATSYCFECEVKLCKTCVSYHQKFPALKQHTLEHLGKLTPQTLAANRHATCGKHAKRATEAYCPVHEELMCTLCATTDHRGCAEVKVIAKVASEKRSELQQQAQRLKEKEATISKQIKTAMDKFKVMRSKVNDVHDDLEQTLNEQCQTAFNLIQSKEEETLTLLADVEKVRAAMTSHSRTIDHVVTSAPDDALLQMSKQLTSRLTDLETDVGEAMQSVHVGDLVLDSKLLAALKSDLCALGQAIRLVVSGAALAQILRNGDRVRRGQDWHCSNTNIDKGGPGTVTAIPSKKAVQDGVISTGLVDVRWDAGGEHYYCMGQEDLYELELV
ncbi:transcription intermediary factor 1-beta-like [Littorina saxatilis]|uniref:Uncharacterized protein n=1 Tax=Littorina saxatilis TaxID=31220 RepID=A0AAN9AIG7_9CAEN